MIELHRRDPPFVHIRLLESVVDQMSPGLQESLLNRLRTVTASFPALDGGSVTVAKKRPDSELLGSPVAQADPHNNIVFVPVDEYTFTDTLYHELAHLAVHERVRAGEDHPRTSEPYTSLYALARMDADEIEMNVIPYVGAPTVPKAEWPEIAQTALDERGEWHAYIQRAQIRLGVEDGDVDG